MLTIPQLIKRPLVLFFFVSSFLFSGVALAENTEQLREEMKQYGVKIKALREDANSASLSQDIDQAQQWLDEALVQFGKEEFETVKTLLRRVSAQLDLIDANVNLLLHRGQAELMEEELSQLRQELVLIQAKQKELETKEGALQEAVRAQQK